MKAKAKSKAGRKPKIGEKEEAAIVAVLSVGCSMLTAARHVGVDVKTIRNHRRAKPDFSLRVDRAVADGEFCLAQKIAGAPQWQAAAFLLERRFGKRWGKREPAPPAGTPGAVVNVYQLSEDELVRIATGGGKGSVAEAAGASVPDRLRQRG